MTISNFSELNININNILFKVITNQNLCKLIYYNTEDCLYKEDIPDTSILLFNNIFPYPFDPSTITDKISILNIYLNNFTSGENVFFKDGLLCFDFISHQNIWKIDSGLRPFSALHEIDSLFGLQDNIVGLGKIKFNNCGIIYPATKFVGYRISYKIKSSSSKLGD